MNLIYSGATEINHMTGKGIFFALIAVVLLAAAAAIQADAQECSMRQTRPCGSNVGECQSGLRVCQDGEWGDCIGDTAPQAEICDNGIDDDCDGATDDCIVSFIPLVIILGVLLFVVMGLLIKMGF